MNVHMQRFGVRFNVISTYLHILCYKYHIEIIVVSCKVSIAAGFLIFVYDGADLRPHE